jgi:speckle-type POZ protein
VTVNVKKVRSGLLCIRLQWETPTKCKTQLFTSEETKFSYWAKFNIENQMCRYKLSIDFSLKSRNKVNCSVELNRIANRKNVEEENKSRPCAASLFINGEETRHRFNEGWIWDQWRLPALNGSFAYPDGKDFTDITTLTWVTTKPNEWKPLTCHLWLEFETFAIGEKNALKQLTELFVQQNLCDVQFNFENDQHIGGHSHILVARSPVFAAMFQHEMKETKTGQVSIQDIQPCTFKQMLHYIYSGRLSLPLTETSAKRLFEAADKYDIGDLKEECIDFLLTCINVNNVINLMAWAHIHSVDQLTEETLKFTSLHGKEISKQRDWENLTKNYPEVCLEATRRIIDQMSLSSKR